MRRLAVLLLSALVAFPVAAEPAMLKPELKEWKLDNGLEVVYLGVHRSPVVAVQLWYHVGSKDEGRSQRGSAHMFEHMMFRGTRLVPPQQHAQMVLRLGGTFDAFTREDLTAYAETVPRQALDFAVRLEADRMRNLVFRKEMVDTEREVVKEEKRLRIDNSPIVRAIERFRRIAYTRHPYASLAAGTIEDLDTLRPSDLHRFYDTYYRPNNAVLVVVGDVSEEEVRTAAQRWFGPLERGNEPPRPSKQMAEPPQTARKKEVVGSSQIGVVIGGYHIPAARSEDVYALQVLANVLGGESMRLTQRIVRKDQIGVFGGAQTLVFEEPGLFFVIGAYLSPEQGALVEAALDDEVARVGRESITEAELVKAKNQLSAAYVLGLQTVEGIAGQIGTAKILLGDARAWVEDYDRYQAVTAADVMRVAKTYLIPENQTVVIVAPGGNK